MNEHTQFVLGLAIGCILIALGTNPLVGVGVYVVCLVSELRIRSITRSQKT